MPFFFFFFFFFVYGRSGRIAKVHAAALESGGLVSARDTKSEVDKSV